MTIEINNFSQETNIANNEKINYETQNIEDNVDEQLSRNIPLDTHSVIMGRKIKQLRLSKKLTLSVLGKYLDCSPTALCLVEKGERNFSKIDLLAEILGVSEEYLLDDTLFQQEIDEEEQYKDDFFNRLENSKIIELKYSDVINLHKKFKGLSSLPNDIKAKILQKGIFVCTVDPSDFK